MVGAALLSCGARTELSSEEEPTEPPPMQPDCTLEPLPALRGRVWDQTPLSLDFEGPFVGDDRGIVESFLATDGMPVYAGLENNPSTHGFGEFDVWFHDTPDRNLSAEFELPLEKTTLDDVVGFVSDAFFPIDDQLLGNEGRPHNFHFTVKLSSPFRYNGNEVFAFEGDDDLFVFVNGLLQLDLGGVHSAESGTIVLQDIEDEADLVNGEEFELDVFFAERHTSGSVFRLALFGFERCQ